MKTVRALIRCSVLLGASLILVRADGGSAAAPAPAPASKPSSPTGPWLMWAPPQRPETGDAPEWNGATGSGVGEGGSSETDTAAPENAERVAEQTYAINQERLQHPEDEASFNQTAKQQAYDDDWMLRNYTDQLKKRHLEKSDFKNPYLVPDPLDQSKNGLSSDPLADPPETKKTRPAGMRPGLDVTSTLTPTKPLTSAAFQPLLAPLASGATANRLDATEGLTDDDTGNASASLLPVPNAGATVAPANSNDGSVASLLDVPGLTAASQGGLRSAGIDLDDSGLGASNRARPIDDFVLPTARGSDVSEFFKKQAEALAPPTVAGTLPIVAVPVKPRLIVDPEPVAKPVISGLRTHVDDPFDILQR